MVGFPAKDSAHARLLLVQLFASFDKVHLLMLTDFGSWLLCHAELIFTRRIITAAELEEACDCVMYSYSTGVWPGKRDKPDDDDLDYHTDKSAYFLGHTESLLAIIGMRNFECLEDWEKAFLETGPIGRILEIIRHELGHGSFALVYKEDSKLVAKLIGDNQKVRYFRARFPSHFPA